MHVSKDSSGHYKVIQDKKILEKLPILNTIAILAIAATLGGDIWLKVRDIFKDVLIYFQ